MGKADQQSGPDSGKKKRRSLRSEFRASRSVLVISGSGLAQMSGEQVSPSHVGWKACGLAVLPAEWTPPFFVISALPFHGTDRDALSGCVAECCSRLGIPADAQLIVRSSGTAETMCDRGSLVSEFCSSNDVFDTIEKLHAQISGDSRSLVHWVVQQAVPPLHKGHLSNERRVSWEPRDWIVEFEPMQGDPGYATSLGVRNWRGGTQVSSADLHCTSGAEITVRLREAARWALQFTSRIHFEWVWDGTRVWIVQADAAEPAKGIDPTSILPAEVPVCSVAGLRAFRLAAAADYESYGKLRNAKLYGELGYTMPPFYVLNDPGLIDALFEGRLSSELEKDLGELMKRPLIIRTDGANIPTDKREMLPRSDPLGSVTEAREWLLDRFPKEIKEADLVAGQLCLIAHHFIPSVASAWARAEPGNRIVRIESLWGIPEGLYWYSHDTFEIDTQNVALEPVESFSALPFTVFERLRYKGTFVATTADGKWKPTQVLPPNDWRPSIKRKPWLFEIAYTTRRIAEIQKYPVAVMWFVGNHTDATEHIVLPWYHSKSELLGMPRAAPRRKTSSIGDFSIKSGADWSALRQDLEAGKRIERVVVEPTDAELLRNRDFAEKLADLAATRRFVIELSGGILAHVYYVLTRRGAQVECIDLFGAKEDIIEYNKIIRDKVPELIAKRGERAETVQLQGDALVTGLRQKLVEEAFEALEAKSGEDLIGELADVTEVVRGICKALNVSPSRLELEASEKHRKRGGFEKGLMLIRTATPHSIQPNPSMSETTGLELTVEAPISATTALPHSPLYRRPDLRLVDQQPEKLFSFATEANKLGQVKATLHFSMPTERDEEQAFVLTIELRRAGVTIRGNVRLRAVPSQMEIEFLDT